MSGGGQNPLDTVLAQLAELRDQVVILEEARSRHVERLSALEAALARKKQETYQPVPAPRWWQATDEERRAAIVRLRSWVDTVYRPCYGHLAARLRECWDQHDLCLILLDWLSESWTVIHKPAIRDSGLLWTSMDWHTRFLPAAAALLQAEAADCDHLVRPAAAVDPFAGAS